MPEGLIPRATDTRETLKERLAQSDLLDAIHVLKAGNGKGGRVALNGTNYKQPRRMSSSLAAGQASMDEDGHLIQPLYGYTHYGRALSDARCRLMPDPVLQLMLRLWHIAKPYLSAASRASPPTACQLLFFYVLFGSSMGRHRDRFTTADFQQYLQALRDGKSEGDLDPVASQASHPGYSQKAGTEVLVWTDGNTPMTLKLSFPDPKNPLGGKATYIVNAKFSVKCSEGTLFIFTPFDDFFFCHESAFDDVDLDVETNAAGHRFAYVFRWLCVPRDF